MFVHIRRSRNDQQYALLCITPLFYILAPTSQQPYQLNTLLLLQTLYYVLIFYMLWASSIIFRRHYTSGFWCELRALLAVGWLQVVGRLVYWA
jgi:hypothetical protein